MNCSEFQEIVQDLARRDGPGSEHASHEVHREHEDALAHARVCAGCDEALAEAASLTAGLRASARSYGRTEAPARVEVAVLAAYRQSWVPSRRSVGQHWRLAVMGLATAAVLTMAIFLYHPAQHTTLKQGIEPAAIRSLAPALAKQNAGNLARGGAASGGSAQTPAAPLSRPPVNVASGNAPNSSQDESSFEDISATSGTFMPLPYADEGPIENATVVRAVLPGTTLSAFGLPVTDGAAEGKVVADFIVGEDGTPEAIRIVR